MPSDPQTQTPEQREAELRAAVWRDASECLQRSLDLVDAGWGLFGGLWRAPDGRLFGDAYGAWCVMRQEADNAK